jgi:hypothetical protein
MVDAATADSNQPHPRRNSAESDQADPCGNSAKPNEPNPFGNSAADQSTGKQATGPLDLVRQPAVSQSTRHDCPAFPTESKVERQHEQAEVLLEAVSLQTPQWLHFAVQSPE